MVKIHTYLFFAKTKKDFTHSALSLLSASAVLRNESSLREILFFLRKKKFSKRKIYEALLQTHLFAGFPSALISLSVYSEYFTGGGLMKEKQDSRYFRERGEKNCRKIYGDKFEKLVSNINSFSPELAEWLVTEGYGKVFGRKGLSLKEREVCNVAMLTALKYESQLYSHINGAHRLGLHWTEIRKIIESLSLLNKNDCVMYGKRVLNTFVKKSKRNKSKNRVNK